MEYNFKLPLNQDANLDKDLSQFLRDYFLKSKHNFFALYPDDHLLTQAHSLISEYYKVDPAQLLITKDANTAITHIIEAFYSSLKTTVSYWPVYNLLYHHMNNLLSQKKFRFIILKARNSQFVPNEDIAEVIKKYDVQFVYIAFPNSYCGYKPSLEKIKQVCENIPNGFVIADEVYYEYTEESCNSLFPSVKNLIVVRSFSKTHGLAGLRIGCIIAQPEIVHKLKDWRKYANPSNVALEALSHILLNGREVFQKSIENNKKGLKLLKRFFIEAHCQIITAPTSYILVKRDKNNKKLQKFLNLANVRSFSNWPNDLNQYYRISTAPEKILKPFLSAI